MVLIDLTADQLLALARYLDHQRRKHPEVAGEALAEALERIDREAVFLLYGERAARRRFQPAQVISKARLHSLHLVADPLPGMELHTCPPEGPCSCEPS